MFDKLITLLQEFYQQLNPFVIIDMWEKGLHLRMGKFHDIKEPGLHVKIPFIDSIWKQTVVTQSLDLRPQSITSADYRNIVVKAIVRYNISDAFLFLTKLAHPTDVLIDTTGAMIREIIEERNWEDLVDVEDELTQRIGEKLKEWGITIERITLTDLAEIQSIRIIGDSVENKTAVVLQNLEHT